MLEKSQTDGEDMRSSDEARGLLNIGLARDSSLDERRRHHGTAHPSGIHCVDDRWAGGDHLDGRSSQL
jgi:hypothetical protein